MPQALSRPSKVIAGCNRSLLSQVISISKPGPSQRTRAIVEHSTPTGTPARPSWRPAPARAASRRAHRLLAAPCARACARAPGGRAVPAGSGQMELLKDLRSHAGISTRRGGGGNGMESARCSSGPGSVPRAGTKARRAQSKAATRCRPLPCRCVEADKVLEGGCHCWPAEQCEKKREKEAKESAPS